ncbi:hypothetical protein DSM112329_00518 [Paraconexibacter sp. AEG42_29]|uniref:Uncharacterized protein n=1 Tax=Paraconexibacter sp. AEG42_29 TaxID=2997339 RepID=A0AAU7APT4_9ACTN
MRKLTLLPLAAIAATALIPASASAKVTRCDGTRGVELAKSKIVKIYKVKQGSKNRYYGCAKPRGPVIALTQTFTGNQVKMVAAKGAYAAFTRTISGSDTISVVDARTGKKKKGLFPPSSIEFDIDNQTPQIGAARINDKGALVVAYSGLGDGQSTDSQTYIYGFDADGAGYDQQFLDSGTSSKVPPKSIKLSGDVVTWTNSGKTRTAKLDQNGLSIVSGGGLLEGDVTTTPAGGIACHITKLTEVGSCVGAFAPSSKVTVTATGPANSTVTITGACTASHAPVPGEATSVATCEVTMSDEREVKVTFA